MRLKNTKQHLKTFLAEKVNLRFVAAAPFLLCTPVPASSDLENYLYERDKNVGAIIKTETSQQDLHKSN